MERQLYAREFLGNLMAHSSAEVYISSISGGSAGRRKTLLSRTVSKIAAYCRYVRATRVSCANPNSPAVSGERELRVYVGCGGSF